MEACIFNGMWLRPGRSAHASRGLCGALQAVETFWGKTLFLAGA